MNEPQKLEHIHEMLHAVKEEQIRQAYRERHIIRQNDAILKAVTVGVPEDPELTKALAALKESSDALEAALAPDSPTPPPA